MHFIGLAAAIFVGVFCALHPKVLLYLGLGLLGVVALILLLTYPGLQHHTRQHPTADTRRCYPKDANGQYLLPPRHRHYTGVWVYDQPLEQWLVPCPPGETETIRGVTYQRNDQGEWVPSPTTPTTNQADR